MKPRGIVSFSQTCNFPYLEWRGCLDNDNYFVLRYEKGYVYFAAHPRELIAAISLKGFKFSEYPEISEILEEIDLTPPADWIDLQR